MQAAAPLEQLHDLTLLVKAHHPLIWIDTADEQRASSLLEHLADDQGLPFFCWQAHKGLARKDQSSKSIYGTADPLQALDHVMTANFEAIYHLQDFSSQLERVEVIARIKEIYNVFYKHKAAIVLTGQDTELPSELAPLFTVLALKPPSNREYHVFLNALLRDLRARMPVAVNLDEQGVSRLITLLHGLTLFEVKKVMTQAIAGRQCFDEKTIEHVLEAKKEIIGRSGVLEFFPAEHGMKDIAGLENLKKWLKKREAIFQQPERAKEFGLNPPKGILLLGVQGCGKSMCAKAVAAEWKLPLVRFDPSNLYQKYLGESEKNLKRAIQTAEAMAPVVLWIDEIEKAFGQGSDNDGGVSSRIFGTLLSWMQEKQDNVFVIATSNNISQLPPELLRKGRFDEIFFVDLPSTEVRATILKLHIKRRGHLADSIDFDALAEATEGFSGAELEQAIVSALYTAFSEQRPLDTELIHSEIKSTQPLSVTMSEKISALRNWAKGRAAPAS
ncbi:MAG: AAA family ATPase [Myxococcales bacterium]|nr:MAG: AAA family ATPase [Myxococcales bacterium]